MVTKICPWDGGVCSKKSCSFIMDNGNVGLCWRHRNPNGRFRRHEVFVDVLRAERSDVGAKRSRISWSQV